MTSAHRRSRMRDTARRGSSYATQLYRTSHLRSDEPAVHIQSGTTIAALQPRDAALPHLPIKDWFLSTSLTGSRKNRSSVHFVYRRISFRFSNDAAHEG